MPSCGTGTRKSPGLLVCYRPLARGARVKLAQRSFLCLLAASLHTTQCASLRRLHARVPASGLRASRGELCRTLTSSKLAADGVWLRRLRRRGPLLQVLPDLQGVHEEHRRQIHLRPRAAAASSPCAPTAPSTPRRAQAQEDYYECLHHKKEFTRRNEVEAHRAAAGKGGGHG